MPSRLSPARIALMYTAFAALWIVASGILLTFSVDDPLLQSRLELAKGLVFVAVTGGLLYLLLKGWHESFGTPTSVRAGDVAPLKTTRLVLLFVALALVVPLFGLAVTKLQGPQIEREAYANLEAVARLKSEQIQNWLAERQGDSLALATDKDFALRVDQFMRQPDDARLAKPILERFANLRTSYSYDSVLLLDRSGKLLLILGAEDDNTPALQKQLRQAIASRQVQRGELFRDETGQIHLDWVVPVPGPQAESAGAAVVLRVTAQQFLFPLIQNWPTVSASAETLLVRRDGESVLFLNSLRHRQDAALSLRLSLAEPELPAAIALRSARPGTTAGKDHRGVSVLAAYRPVAGTDWSIVAKIDRVEVLAPLHRLVLWVSLVAFSAFAALSAALLLLWRQQQRMQNLALRESEATYRSLFDNMLNGFAYCHMLFDDGQPRDFIYLDVNKAFEVQTGLKNVVGRKISEVVPGIRESDPGLFETYGRVALTGQPEKFETYVEAMRMWFAISVYSPKPEYFVAVFDVITERKLAEQAIEKERSRLAAILKTASDGIHIFDADGLLVDANDAFLNMLGYDRAVIGRMHVFDFDVQLDAETILANIKKLFGRHGALLVETQHRRSDGRIINVEINCCAVRIDGGDYLYAASRDVTERTQIAAKLVASEAHLKALVQTIPDLVWLKDAEGVYLGCNPIFERFFGASEVDIIGKTDYDFVDKELADFFRMHDGKAMAAGKPSVNEEWLTFADDGHRGLFETVKTPMVDAQGTLIGVLGIARDITERHVAEAKILRLSQLYAALSQCNQAIVRCVSEAELFPQICRDAVQFGGLKMAWIGLIDPAMRRVRPAASFGDGVEYLQDIEISLLADSSFGRSPTATAIRQERPFWCQDFMHDPITAPWQERAAQFGWNAMAALPLRRDGIVVGAFILYASAVNFFDQDTRKLLIEMTTNIDFALNNFVRENKRKLAEQELRIAATAFQAQEAIVVTDAHNVILRANQAFTRLTGYSAEEAVGQTPSLLKSGRQGPDFYRDMWQSLHRDNYWQGEIWNRYKNGEVHPGRLAISATTNTTGQVTNFIGTYYDLTQSKLADEKIHRLAFYDPLTNLPNRRLLHDRLQHSLTANARHQQHGAVLFIDLDNFKTFNDTKGHDFGDLLLMEVARRLQACVRDEDTVARLSGDEFIIMLEQLSDSIEQAATQTEAIADKILAAVSQPYLLRGDAHHCSASIGISLFRNQEITVEEILKRADTAMYEAKNAGRNTLRFYDPAVQAALQVRTTLESDLRRALLENQFRLYYQMQVDRARVHGAEALIRWQHPVRGLISPLEFIPLAEQIGLILPIGQWVLETACAQLKTWENDPLTRDLQLAVNVSAHQFRQVDFVEQVQQSLRRHAINPERLKLELTESLVLVNIADTVAKMQRLKQDGVHFSMDDFGTGYSSLAYLTQLPLDQLKIDQSFVRNIGVKHSDAVIVQTIIGMANNLAMEVIAEGVETEAQRAFLEQHGCTLWQGFLFSRPVPLEAFEASLKKYVDSDL